MVEDLCRGELSSDWKKLSQAELREKIEGEGFTDADRTEFDQLYNTSIDEVIKHVKKLLRWKDLHNSKVYFGKARNYLTDNEILIPATSVENCRQALHKVWELYTRKLSEAMTPGYWQGSSQLQTEIQEAFNNLAEAIRKEIGVAESIRGFVGLNEKHFHRKETNL